jgi:histone-lysine N-methyltransferase SETD1
MEPADPGDLIIEYVGELVRASVANIREWKYEREYRGDGIASSYLFRLDGIMVIDATYKGNLARFINHSCDPNCVAKTIILNGSKRIVMYAKKSIRSGEEITYDYKFPPEKDPNKKVKCLCGSNSCRKFLN